MLNSYTDSISTGTAANRLRQAKSYIQFCVYYDVNPLYPNISQLCMYAQYLSNSHASPRTVKNYMSGARTWVCEHSGSVICFDSHDVSQIVKGFAKRSQHVPARAFPLSISHILIISDYVSANLSFPKSLMPCIVIGYKCFLRASNLVSPSTTEWGGPHTLLARDMVVCDSGLLVSVRSTKTKSDNVVSTLHLPKETDPRLCPVVLWTNYYQLIRPWYLGPAFLLDNHSPITARHVVGAMRSALALEPDLDPAKVSMHSLRRGAAHDAAERGASLDAIKDMGMWRSTSGVKPYLDKFPHMFKR